MAVPHVTSDYENDCLSKDNANVSQMDWEAPTAQGLYDPQNEHEACGVGFIVAIDGRRSHKVCFVFNSLEYSIVFFVTILSI